MSVEIVPGFRLIERWRDMSVEDALCGIVWEQPTLRIFGREVLAPRLTAWFGTGAYTYAGKRHEPSPMPEWVDAARLDIERMTGATFNSVLLNYYRDGRDSVSWHADDEPELGDEPTIASWSIGAYRTFAMRANSDARTSWRTLLGGGDLLIMSGRSQLDYQHSVPKTTRPIGPRINPTFRMVK